MAPQGPARWRSAHRSWHLWRPADELADLKAQLEALQSRVNTIEQQPAQASNLPPGASFVTFERGSRMDFVQQDRVSDRGNQNDDAGFTIAITPTADMPAPVAEIVVYGYVKGDVIYDVTGSEFGSTGNKFSFSMPGADRHGEEDDEFVFLHVLPVPLRHQVEGRHGGGPDPQPYRDGLLLRKRRSPYRRGSVPGSCNEYCPRLRQAYGEWDMTRTGRFSPVRPTRSPRCRSSA